MRRGDPLVRDLEVHQRGQAVWFTRALGGQVEDRPAFLRFVSGMPVFFANGLTSIRLKEDDVDVVVKESMNLFRRHGVPAGFWIGPLTEPDELPARLESLGLELRESIPWMHLDLDSWDGLADWPDGLVIERVGDRDSGARWLAAMNEGFGSPEPVAETFRRIEARIGHAEDLPYQRFVGSLEDRPVASAGLMLFGGLAGVYNVATRPDVRRRGIGAAMTATALREARARGHHRAVLGTSEMGRGVYGRMGFRELCRVDVYAMELPPDGGDTVE